MRLDCESYHPVNDNKRWISGVISFVMLVGSITAAAVPVTRNLVMHLDAGAISGLSDGSVVTLWPDSSGRANNAVIGSDVADYPIYKTGILNGRPVVCFGPNNSYFTFNEISDIRTVFWVCKEDVNASYNRFLLGHHSKWNFHRGHYAIWDGYWASPSVYNGTTCLNGAAVDGTTTTVPKSYSIISLRTTGYVSADQLSRDRGNTAASWQGDIAEIIVYDRVLSDTEENSVGAYLAGKYGISTSYTLPNEMTELYTGTNYSAWLDGRIVEIRNSTNGVLTRWPIGTTVTPADCDQALEAVADLPSVPYITSKDNGTDVVTWTWQLPQGALSQQVETLKFYDNYVEQKVKVQWRNSKPVLWRVNYGGRLAGGCYDLEGIWSKNNETPAVWLPAPVPEYFTYTGSSTYKKKVISPSSPVPADMTVVIGGVDDEDITYWDSAEIGRTPLDYGAGSWGLERRYAVNASLITPGAEQVLRVEVPNSGGYGGIWKTPCVMGSAAVLGRAALSDGWTRATAPGQKIYSWCPDSYSNYERTLTGRFTVSLSSQDRTVEVVPENITTGGRFQIPPYVVAIDGTYGFWGIGTLDLPRAEDGLRVEWKENFLTCPFLLKTGDPSETGMWTEAPRIGILIGNSRKSIMDNYLAAIPPRPHQQMPDWWTGPEYCTWGDQVYYDMLYGGGPLGALSNSHIQGWLSDIKTLGLTFSQITLDAGWWQLSKSIIDQVHADGQHAVFWTQPHWGTIPGHSTSWGVKDTAGRVIYDSSGGNIFLDFTQPAVRSHMAAEYGGYFTAWNADGIKLDFAYVTRPIWNVMADERWGAGEQYRARVLEFCYQIIKNNKADGLLTGACSNPLFGEVQSLCRLNEEWTGDSQAYRRRAKAVLETGEWIMSDDWNAYEHYLPDVLVERSVWGCPTIQSVKYRGDARNYPVPLTGAWAKRIKAVTYLASQAAIKSDQQIVYDARDNVSRTTPAGAVVAAALPLNGQHSPSDVLLVSAPGRLLVASIADGSVTIPTPVMPYKVYSIGNDGSRKEAAFTKGDSEIMLNVADAAGSVSYYELITCDFNGDASIDMADLGELVGRWVSVSEMIDVTGDGVVGLADFAVLANQWMQPR